MQKSPKWILAGVIGLQLAAPVAAFAGVYEAICAGGNRCTVTMANGQISMPGNTIDKDRILSWAQGGSGSKTDVGMGVGAVVLFGLPGLIGFGAKKHDYQFSISYVDDQGNIQMATVQFKNNTPANQFMMELMGMTGLSMGSVNTTLQSKIEQVKAEKAEKDRLANLECGKAVKPFKCSWSAYLDANPGVKAWAEKNPKMAEAEKVKQGAID
jgi:hypothetical protein